MGKTKFVEVNYHLANIWDDAFNIVLAHIVEAAAAVGTVTDQQLNSWILHATCKGDSLAFTYVAETDADEAAMAEFVDSARERILAIGDVTPEAVANWSLGENNRKVSEGTLRGNETVDVERLLEVTDWLANALRWEPDTDYGAEVGVPRRELR